MVRCMDMLLQARIVEEASGHRAESRDLARLHTRSGEGKAHGQEDGRPGTSVLLGGKSELTLKRFKTPFLV